MLDKKYPEKDLAVSEAQALLEEAQRPILRELGRVMEVLFPETPKPHLCKMFAHHHPAHPVHVVVRHVEIGKMLVDLLHVRLPSIARLRARRDLLQSHAHPHGRLEEVQGDTGRRGGGQQGSRGAGHRSGNGSRRNLLTRTSGRLRDDTAHTSDLHLCSRKGPEGMCILQSRVMGPRQQAELRPSAKRSGLVR